MAVMQSHNNRTLIAATDLSAAQFKFITLDADGANLAGSAGEAVFGVCLAGAAAGDVVAGYARESAVDNQIIEIELIQGGNVVPA